jgi:hypothetical protein
MFKKIKLYREYKRIISSNKVNLEANFNIRIDDANRLYTVINITELPTDDAYNLKKSDIDKLSEPYIKEYVKKLTTYLNSIGLNEIYDFYEPIKKVDKYSYLIIIGFKPFNSVDYNTVIYFRLIPFSIISVFIFLIIYYFTN